MGDDDFLTSLLVGSRLLAGWACAAVAVLDLSMGVSLRDGPYLLFHVVLLMPHRIRLPRFATAVTMTATALVGALAGLTSKTTQTCCTYAEFSERGWPFHWAQRSALGDTANEAHLLVKASTWHVDLVALAGTLLVFAYVGMLLIVVTTLIRRHRRQDR